MLIHNRLRYLCNFELHNFYHFNCISTCFFIKFNTWSCWINFWTEDKLFEDVEFYWRFYTQHPDIYIIDQPLYIYRRHQSSIMSRSIVDIDYHKNLFYVTENIYKFLNEQGLFEKYKETFLKFVAQKSTKILNMTDKFLWWN